MGNRKMFCNQEDTIKQEFNEDPKFKRNGKEVSIKDYIQENKEDCEIYQLIEKYGSMQEVPMSTEIIKGDISAIKNLRDIKDREVAERELWEKLPRNIRNEFGNNIYEFRQNGEKWLNNKINIENQKRLEIQKQIQIQQEQAKIKE